MRTRSGNSGLIKHCLLLVLVLTLAVALAACGPTPQAEATATAAEPLLEVHSAVTPTARPSKTPTTIPVSISTTTITPAPTQTFAATATAVLQTYVIQSGDNLTIIADKFGTTIDALQIANGLLDGNAILADQELVIPAAGEDLQAAPVMELAAPSASPSPIVLPDGNVSIPPVETAAADEAAGTAPRILPNHIACPVNQEAIPAGATVVGLSAVCSIPIVSYQLGEGPTSIVVVGGIHGGYEWNTVLLAYEILDYLQQNPQTIPPSITLHLIPNANPDGLYAVTQKTDRFTALDVAENTVPGRFNGNNVDLNRNWDCQWSPTAVWRDMSISGGTAPFSEPENQALRAFILGRNPAAAIFLHSAATGIYVAGCGQIDPSSRALAEIYSTASGYPIYEGFQHYVVTGDAGDWLAMQGLPSITIELSSHSALDWNMNLMGLQGIFQYLAGEELEPYP